MFQLAVFISFFISRRVFKDFEYNWPKAVCVCMCVSTRVTQIIDDKTRNLAYTALTKIQGNLMYFPSLVHDRFLIMAT